MNVVYFFHSEVPTLQPVSALGDIFPIDQTLDKTFLSST